MKKLFATLSLLACLYGGIANASDTVFSSYPYLHHPTQDRGGRLPYMSFGQVVQLDGTSRLLDSVRAWRCDHSAGTFKFTASIYKTPKNVYRFDASNVRPIWTKSITKIFQDEGIDAIDFSGSKTEIPDSFLIIFTVEKLDFSRSSVDGATFCLSTMPRLANNRINIGTIPTVDIYVRYPNLRDQYLTSSETPGLDPWYMGTSIAASPKPVVNQEDKKDDPDTKINP